MTDVKPWYESKTIWSSLIAILAAVGSVFGFNLDQESQMQMSEIALQLVTVVASVLAVFGRLSAKSIID